MINPSRRTPRLTAEDWEVIAIVSDILLASSRKHPRRAAGIAEDLGCSPQYVAKLMAPTDSATISLVQVERLSPPVRAEFHARYDQQFNASAPVLPLAASVRKAERALDDVVTELGRRRIETHQVADLERLIGNVDEVRQLLMSAFQLRAAESARRAKTVTP